MTDRLGGSGPEPRFNPIGPVQGVQGVGAAGRPTLPAVRPNGPRFATDALEISEQTRSYYAALIEGRAADADPELMLHLQLVHGPNSPLFEGLQATEPGRALLAAPAAPAGPTDAPPWQPREERPQAGPLERFLTRTFQEVAFAWKNFAATQPW